MRIIFRADASREMGSGHVLRSSVLAEEAISRGYECIFIGQISGLDWVADWIANINFSAILKPEDKFQVNSETDVLLIDSYSIPLDSEFISIENWLYTMSISDAISPRYIVHAELRPSLEIQNHRNSRAIVLSGPDYILTRLRITKIAHHESFNEKPCVLIVGGGSDPFGFVKEITQVIGGLDLDLSIHCFSNDDIPNHGMTDFNSHKIGPNLDNLAEIADVVLTTASTTSLEFIAREIPVGVVCAVDNQQDYYEQLGRRAYASQIGFRDSLGQWTFDLDELRNLLTDSEKRKSLKNSIRGLIDLKGAARVIDFIEIETSKKI